MSHESVSFTTHQSTLVSSAPRHVADEAQLLLRRIQYLEYRYNADATRLPYVEKFYLQRLSDVSNFAEFLSMLHSLNKEK